MMRRFRLVGLRAVCVVAALLGVAACTSLPSRDAALVIDDAAPSDAARQLIIMVPTTEPDGRADVVDAIVRDYPITRVKGGPFVSIGMHGIVGEVDAGHEVRTVHRQLAADPRIALVQPLRQFHLDSTTYDDTLFAAQQSLRTLDVPPVHALVRGRGVRVAVVDSAVDTTHPDLRPRVAESRDFVVGVARPADGERHGTAIAGVIGACAVNGQGIVGVAPEVDLLALRSCSEGDTGADAGCSGFAIAQALDYALLAEVDVINLSLAGPYDELMERLITRALDDEVVVVASQAETTSFPASIPGVLGVEIAHSEGARTALAAPGIDILTTLPGGRYGFLDGSSLATAHVSGVAALVREADPSLPPAEVARLLRDGQPRSVSACRSVRTALERTGATGAAALLCAN